MYVPGMALCAYALAPGLVRDFYRVAVLHHDALDFLADRHHLVDADAPLVPGILAQLAAHRTKRLPGAVEVVVRESRPPQRLLRDVLGLLARAQLARQALRGDEDH